MHNYLLDPKRRVTALYTNWKGEARERTIVPLGILFASTDHHPRPQWLIRSYDVEKNDVRDFALDGFLTSTDELLKARSEGEDQDFVTIPKTKAMAESMYLVAEAWLRDNGHLKIPSKGD